LEHRGTKEVLQNCVADPKRGQDGKGSPGHIDELVGDTLQFLLRPPSHVPVRIQLPLLSQEEVEEQVPNEGSLAVPAREKEV